MKAIKVEGGLTFAQNNTAQFYTLPKSAIDEGAADLVLSPKELAEELEKIGGKNEVFLNVVNDLNEEQIDNNDADFRELFKILLNTTGVYFTLYKLNTLKRRIIRRMMLYKIDTLDKYVKYLDKKK